MENTVRGQWRRTNTHTLTFAAKNAFCLSTRCSFSRLFELVTEANDSSHLLQLAGDAYYLDGSAVAKRQAHSKCCVCINDFPIEWFAPMAQWLARMLYMEFWFFFFKFFSMIVCKYLWYFTKIFFYLLQACRGESGLTQKYAFIKKSTI